MHTTNVAVHESILRVLQLVCDVAGWAEKDVNLALDSHFGHVAWRAHHGQLLHVKYTRQAKVVYN
jgi:hypothetical protein